MKNQGHISMSKDNSSFFYWRCLRCKQAIMNLEDLAERIVGGKKERYHKVCLEKQECLESRKHNGG
jgi:hypothetical protein